MWEVLVNYLYCAVISGNVAENPDSDVINYTREYVGSAVVAWMLFDKDGLKVDSGVTICRRLQIFALLKYGMA